MGVSLKKVIEKILFVIILSAFAIPTLADPVTPDRASMVAQRFMASAVKAERDQIRIVYTRSMPEAKETAFYVVNVGEDAFVIVAGDDAARPVLGYSTSRAFPQRVERLPDNVDGWFEEMARQIAFAAKHQEGKKSFADQWDQLSTDKVTTNGSSDKDYDPLPTPQVGPLLTTTWDQGQYYNALCPSADGVIHALAGCVATAMAQIINYWEYPIHGKGIYSYDQFFWGTLSVNYDTANYDYSNMPDILTSTSSQEEVLAVAKLIYHCGVAAKVEYDAICSGAIAENMRVALINHFNYSVGLGYADRHMYTEEEWVELMKNEINENAPVLYTGTNGSESHAFVLDGYKNDDYFHFNFGWEGDGDGWYLTSAINPSPDFNYWQQAIVGIRPNSNQNTVLSNFKAAYDYSSATYNKCREYYKVSDPIHLFNISARNDYKMNYNNYGAVEPIIMHFLPTDSLGQLVLDVLQIGEEHAIVVYDGTNMDSLICVLEPNGVGYPWAHLPDNPEWQQRVTNNFSPIVSSRNGFTILAYCTGMIEDEFHLVVSDASDCRMVSGIESTKIPTGFMLNWSENGNNSQ